MTDAASASRSRSGRRSGGTAWDVVVVGGGPVGRCAGLHAARAGLRVAVVEPRPTPIDKACGEGLMPTALRELALLGVDPPGRDFVGIRYVDAGRGLTVATEFTGGPGRGVRRTALHEAIAVETDRHGVCVVADRVVGVGWDATRAAVTTASGHRLVGRYVLGADGLHSDVRRQLGLQRAGRGARRHGLRQHFAVDPWDDHVAVHWADDVEAYVTPVGQRCVGIALLTSAREPFDVLLHRFPELRRRLGEAEPMDRVRGAGPLRQPVVSPRRGRVLLVGDAAGYIDALTGEGLAMGLVSARLAVEAIVADEVPRYAARWRRATWRSRLLTEAMVRAATTDWARPKVVSGSVSYPWTFRRAVQALA
jgi:flavin-dependent dehydrogenase